MKIRYYIFEVCPGPDHDRLLSRFLDRASALGCQATRSAINCGGMASKTAIMFEGVVAEPGLALPLEVRAENMALQALRDTIELDLNTI